MYDFICDRLTNLTVRARAECKEPTCGAREDGEIVSCSSPNCGEKLMMEGWRRELHVMRLFKNLIEYLERQELEQLEQQTNWKKKKESRSQ